jgi:hypothetical protein
MERVTIIDDAYDSFNERVLSAEDATDLWSRLDFNQEEALAEMEQLGHVITSQEDLTGEVLEALVRSIGVVKIPPIDVEVPHASSDADRTCPT